MSPMYDFHFVKSPHSCFTTSYLTYVAWLRLDSIMSFDIVALGIVFLTALAWDLIFSFTTDVVRPACYHLNENHYEAGFEGTQ